MKHTFWAIAVLSLLLFAAGCHNYNAVAMKLGEAPTIEKEGATVGLRTLQSRRFDTLDELQLLSAGTQAMQDLGFAISESSSTVGVLVGSKQRDAKESGQVVGQVALSITMALFGVYYQPMWDKEQNIIVNLVTMPIQNSQKTEVRVSFERQLTNNHGHLWRSEVLMDEEIYQEFFTLFAQSAFLEAEDL